MGPWHLVLFPASLPQGHVWDTSEACDTWACHLLVAFSRSLSVCLVLADLCGLFTWWMVVLHLFWLMGYVSSAGCLTCSPADGVCMFVLSCARRSEAFPPVLM